MFIGRQEELRILKNDLSGKKKSTILLYGRRRIGKTSLIREVVKDIEDAVVVYHEFHRVTLEKNIAEFSRSIAKSFNLPSLPAFDTIQRLISRPYDSCSDPRLKSPDTAEPVWSGQIIIRSFADNIRRNGISISCHGKILWNFMLQKQPHVFSGRAGKLFIIWLCSQWPRPELFSNLFSCRS